MFVSDRPDVLPFPSGSDLHWSHFDLLRVLGVMPLSGAVDLGRVQGFDHSLVYRRLWALSDRGYISSYDLGAQCEKVSRWYVVPEGMAFLEPFDCLWNSEWALARLLELLPQVEWFYRASADLLPLLGPMVRFRWFRGVSWDAAVRYENGWAAFFWSGLMQGEGRIRETFSKLGSDLVEYDLMGSGAFPSVLYFVVSDSWQRELVFRVARAFGLDQQLQVLCVSDGSVSGVRDSSRGRGWVGQVLEGGSLGGWPLDRRVADSPWSSTGASLVSRVLDGVLEWPGMGARFGDRLIGDAPGNGRVNKCLLSLSEAGFVRRYLSSRSYSYVLDGRGFDLLSRRDRTNIMRRRRNARFSKGPEERDLVMHEGGLMNVAGDFLSRGLAVASGARSWEHLGSGGIAPDALVFLNSSPYGPGWHYVEYELRARGRTTVLDKLRGYASGRRQDRWPVLVIVRNDRVEQLFHEVGREPKIRMLTSTVERLGEYSLLGDARCWSMYGVPRPLA